MFAISLLGVKGKTFPSPGLSCHQDLAMSGLVKLNWDNFSRTITSSLKTFAAEEILQDVTLVSDDLVEVGAHRLLLCSASPVLKEILLRSGGETRPLLFLRGIKHKTLKAILQFLYEGWTSVPQEEVNDVVDVAVDLEIKNEIVWLY